MRAVIVAAAVAFIISLFGTPVAIRVFTALKAGQPIRSLGLASSEGKKGTPAMGGVVFIVATLLAYVAGHLALTTLPERQIAQDKPTMTALVLLGLFVFCGAVGFVDDLLKVRQRNSDGLSAKGKLFGQAIVGAGFGIAALYWASSNGQTVASENISFIRDVSWLDVGKVGSVIVFVFVVTAMSNGVNLTDCLDGLATGASALVLGAYALVGFWQYRHWCADETYARANDYCYQVRDPLEIAMIAAAAAGACVGFLWWNTSPARIFMGDVGSLGLGALIGGLAVATRTTLLSVMIGGLFVIITVTWVIQIVSFRTTNSGRITLADWVTIWRQGHEAGPAKRVTYDSYLRNHILPRFGDTPLNKITRQAGKVFVKDLKQRLAERTVEDVMSLLGLLLREAVADRRIGFNPCQGIRITTGHRPERTPATTQQINRITDRIPRRSDQILVITAAYTGMRWGELAGLAKTNTHLNDGLIRVHPDKGALHEVSGKLYLGPPKSPAAVRDIHLPPFLIGLLQEIIDSHDHDIVFCGARGAFLRRSAMSRRVWRPAVNGNPKTGTSPILEGMHFHDTRHTHKTWLIEDDIPEVVQARRLGHRLPGVRGVYSHVTPIMIDRVITSLQTRWQNSQAAHPAPRRHLHAA